MIGSVLKEVSGIFDQRFLKNAFFPSLIFWSALLWVGTAAQGSFIKELTAWNNQDTTIKAVQLIGFVAWITFFASLLSSSGNAILRFYEGYWQFPGSTWLARKGKAWHQKKLARLATQSTEYEQIYQSYPLPSQPEQVMPTRLGNILKNAELYPMDRYHIDSVLIWPRLYFLLPADFHQTFANARSSLDFMLAISLLGIIFSVLSGIYLLVVKANWSLFLICFWGGFLIAWLAYRSALAAAVVYGQQIKTAFDLYRHLLIKTLRLQLPPSLLAERKMWGEINQFLYRNFPLTSNYFTETPEAGETSPAQK